MRAQPQNARANANTIHRKIVVNINDTGDCIIGFRIHRTITLVVLGVDLCLNLLLTTLFITPLRSHINSPAVRRVTLRNLA